MSDADATSGLDALRGRVERRQRSVPPPRRPRTLSEPDSTVTDEPLVEVTPGDPGVTEHPESAVPVIEQVSAASAAQQVWPGDADRPLTRPGELTANLAVRVRRSVDERLADLIHQFRKEGVRSSKAELVEMLLWELPSVTTDELRSRLAVFRAAAPRETPLQSAR